MKRATHFVVVGGLHNFCFAPNWRKRFELTFEYCSRLQISAIVHGIIAAENRGSTDAHPRHCIEISFVFIFSLFLLCFFIVSYLIFRIFVKFIVIKRFFLNSPWFEEMGS